MEYPVIIAMFKNETPKSIFEVGCANGGLLADAYNHMEVIVGGLDQHEGDLGRSKARFPRDSENFFVWDMNNIPWPVKDKQYDIAFTVGTLLYTENPQEVLKEMKRIAHRVFIAEPEEGNIYKDHHGTRHYHAYKQLLEGEVEDVGLVATKRVYKCK